MKHNRLKIVGISVLSALGVGLIIGVSINNNQPIIPAPQITNQPVVKSRMILPQSSPRAGITNTLPSDQVDANEYYPPNSTPSELAVLQGQIPIIMYHYIRVNDPEDEKGYSLSVTPTHFAQQLDDLQQRGYQTATFKDLANGYVPPKPIILTFDDGYEDFFTTAFPELTRRKMKAVVYVIANFQKPEYLTPGQVRYLANSGIEIGSHTLDHAQLTKASDQDIARQLIFSKQTLEAMTGQPVISMAYPFGSYTAEIVRNTTRAGYLYAVTTVGGLADLTQPMELTRYRAKDTPELDFDDHQNTVNVHSNTGRP